MLLLLLVVDDGSELLFMQISRKFHCELGKLKKLICVIKLFIF